MLFLVLLYILKNDSFYSRAKNGKLIKDLNEQQEEIISQNEELRQQQEELKIDSDRSSIRGVSSRFRNFTSLQFTLEKGDLIYFLSDGFIDQNNTERKRLGSQNFKQLVQKIAHLHLKEQKTRFWRLLKITNNRKSNAMIFRLWRFKYRGN